MFFSSWIFAWKRGLPHPQCCREFYNPPGRLHIGWSIMRNHRWGFLAAMWGPEPGERSNLILSSSEGMIVLHPQWYFVLFSWLHWAALRDLFLYCFTCVGLSGCLRCMQCLHRTEFVRRGPRYLQHVRLCGLIAALFSVMPE